MRKTPKHQVLVGTTEQGYRTRHSANRIQHEVDLISASAYVETDEGRHKDTSSEKEVTTEHSQGTPEAAPHAITTMVNYMGAANIETKEGKDALSAVYAALAKIFGRQTEDEHKAFHRQEVLISKGERLTNFPLPQSVSGRTTFIQAQDI